MPEGTPEKPFHTYGGDTILCIPKDNQDDRAMIDRVQYTVADIYFAGDTTKARTGPRISGAKSRQNFRPDGMAES